MRKHKKTIPNNLFIGTLIIVSLFSFSPGRSQVIKEEKKTTSEIKPGRKKAILILSDGKKIELGAQQDTTLASKVNGIEIKIDSTGINYTENKETQVNKPSAPMPKRKKVNQK